MSHYFFYLLGKKETVHAVPSSPSTSPPLLLLLGFHWWWSVQQSPLVVFSAGFHVESVTVISTHSALNTKLPCQGSSAARMRNVNKLIMKKSSKTVEVESKLGRYCFHPLVNNDNLKTWVPIKGKLVVPPS